MNKIMNKNYPLYLKKLLLKQTITILILVTLLNIMNLLVLMLKLMEFFNLNKNLFLLLFMD